MRNPETRRNTPAIKIGIAGFLEKDEEREKEDLSRCKKCGQLPSRQGIQFCIHCGERFK